MQYCISDVHGCLKTLIALIEQLNLTDKDTVYFLGDLVDRGPDSKGVLDLVMSMPNAIPHMGNHEHMMLKAAGVVPDPYSSNPFDLWMSEGNGGSKTLASFKGKGIEEKYLTFIKSFNLITELANFYLCHAGISSKPMKSPLDTLLWDRECGVNLERTGGRRLICGHTPTPVEDIAESIADKHNKIVIDGGCVFNQYPPLGNLVALRLDDMKLFVQSNVEDLLL